jgi:RNA polymerase sigma-70 factor (ECF subfamily)
MEVARMETAGGTIARAPIVDEIPKTCSHPGDLTLAQRAVERAEGAGREIYAATRERLFAILCYHTGRRDEALELLQETYLSAIRNLHKYRGEGSLLSWLAVIAIRRAQDWKRKIMSWRRHEEAIRVEAESEGNPGSDPDPALKRRLQDALGRLKGNQRAAFLLREMEGMSFREVGDALGCNEATARVHFHRARQAMRSFLSPGPETETGDTGDRRVEVPEQERLGETES